MRSAGEHLNEEKAEDHDEDEDLEEGRDKSKGQKYQKMKKELPDHVIDLIETQSMKASSPREFKTTVINKLFKRNAKGKLVLNLEDQLFQEHKKVYLNKYKKDKETALPEAIMRGLYFNNSQAAFDDAKKAGDIVPVEEGGKTFWSFQSLEKGTVHGKVEEQSLKQSKKVNAQQHTLLGDCFNEVGWSLNYQDKDVKALASGKKIPSSILDIVKQATESQAKLMKEAMVMIKSWKGEKDDEFLVKMKQGHAVCSQNLAKLQHMKEFEELPNNLPANRENLDDLMMGMAVHTKEYNELVETCRGRLRALKK